VTVFKALRNNTWISHVCPLQTSDEIYEYITLWEEIRLLSRVKEPRTRSLGDGQQMENTPQTVLTAFNLRAVLKKYQSP
jgi:hypothetical protein